MFSSLTILCGGMFRMLWPLNRMSPSMTRGASGGGRRQMDRSVVDLPAPLAPIKVTISPCFTSKEMPCRASMLP